MLAAIDFAVIPKAATDPVTLAIVDYRETSGLYYVNRTDENGQFELKINRNHYHAAADLAETVKMVPIDISKPNATLDAFERGDVDHLMTSNGAKTEDILKFAKDRTDVSIHATQKIRKHMLIFTDRGERELSIAQRRWIGSQVREAVQTSAAKHPGYEPTEQFFPTAGDGSLSLEQLQYLKTIPATKVALPKVIRIGMIRSVDLESWGAAIRDRLPESVSYQEKHLPALHQFTQDEEEPHAFIVSTDTGFMEDINLISYSINAGFFGISKDSGQKWLADYMGLKDSESRLAALRQLHFKSLENAMAVPLIASPYVAMIRSPWKIGLSELFANNQLWLIRHP